jgi:hypothetical protein
VGNTYAPNSGRRSSTIIINVLRIPFGRGTGGGVGSRFGGAVGVAVRRPDVAPEPAPASFQSPALTRQVVPRSVHAEHAERPAHAAQHASIVEPSITASTELVFELLEFVRRVMVHVERCMWWGASERGTLRQLSVIERSLLQRNLAEYVLDTTKALVMSVMSPRSAVLEACTSSTRSRS